MKFYHERLEVLEMERPVLGFFSLKLGVFSKLTLDTINKSLEIAKIFLEKSFEF